MKGINFVLHSLPFFSQGFSSSIQNYIVLLYNFAYSIYPVFFALLMVQGFPVLLGNVVFSNILLVDVATSNMTVLPRNGSHMFLWEILFLPKSLFSITVWKQLLLGIKE